MALINYSNIQDQIESVLKADSRTNTSRVAVEEEPELGLADSQSMILVYLENRTARENEQPIAAGTRTHYLLRASIIVVAVSYESYRRASELRNTVLGNLELVLMENRTFNSAVSASWLEGGDMETAKDSSSTGWIAAAETTLVMRVSATT